MRHTKQESHDTMVIIVSPVGLISNYRIIHVDNYIIIKVSKFSIGKTIPWNGKKM